MAMYSDEDKKTDKKPGISLSDIVNMARGQDPQKTAEIKRKADEAAAQYPDAPEEPGIVEDYMIEDVAMGGLTPVGLIKTGVRKAAVSGMKEKMPVSQEAYRKRWNALSGDERDKYQGFDAFLKEQVQADKVLPAAAANKLEKSKQFKSEFEDMKGGPDLSEAYEKTRETRRLMDPSKTFKSMDVVADVDKGKLSERPMPSVEKKQEVSEPVFEKFEGVTHQDKMRNIKKAEEEAALMALREEELRKRKK